MEKRGIVLLVLVLSLFLISLGFVNSVDVSSCQTLSSDTIYVLTQNVTSAINASCFSVNSLDNVTLNCNDYYIFGNGSANNKFGITGNGANINIYNCGFDNWTLQNPNSMDGIFFSGSNSIFENITFGQFG